jgi:hypothetical protein
MIACDPYVSPARSESAVFVYANRRSEPNYYLCSLRGAYPHGKPNERGQKQFSHRLLPRLYEQIHGRYGFSLQAADIEARRSSGGLCPALSRRNCRLRLWSDQPFGPGSRSEDRCLPILKITASRTEGSARAAETAIQRDGRHRRLGLVKHYRPSRVSPPCEARPFCESMMWAQDGRLPACAHHLRPFGSSRWSPERLTKPRANGTGLRG